MVKIQDSDRVELFILLISNDQQLIDNYTNCTKAFPSKSYIQTVTSNYNSAIEELGRKKYDVIFLDLFLFDSGGLLSIKDISNHGLDAKVIVLLPSDKKEMISSVIGAGAYDCIIKENFGPDLYQNIIGRIFESDNSPETVSVANEIEIFENLTKIIPDAVLFADLTGKAIYMSDRIIDLLGLNSCSDFIGRQIFSVIAENQRERAIEEFNKLLETGQMNDIEYEVIKQDGSSIFINVNGSLLKDNKGKPKAVIFIGRDITKSLSFQNELISTRSILEHKFEERTLELEKANEKLRHYIHRHRQVEYITNILYDLALALCISSSLRDAVRLAVDAAILVSKMDCGAIYIWDEGIKSLDMIFQRGLTPDFINQTNHYDYESGIVQLMLTCKPIYSKFNEGMLTVNGSIENEDLKAVALIPLIHQGKLVGTLNVASRTFSEVSFITRQSLETIAVQIGGIIARFKSEEAMARNKERLRTQFDSIPIPTYIWEKIEGDMVLVDFNQTAKIFSQGKLDEWRGVKAIELIKDNEEAYKLFIQSINDKKNCEKEIRYCFKTTGETRNLLLKMAYIPDGQVLLHAMDITEIKRAEEVLKNQSQILEEKVLQRTSELEKAYNDLTLEMGQRRRAEKDLAESETRYRSLIEAKGDLIGEIDLEGLITYISPQIEKVLGYSYEEVIGKMNITDIIAENGNQDFLRLLAEYIAGPVFIQTENASIRRKDGKIISFEVSAIPIFDDKGILTGIRGLGTDITDKIEAADKIKKIQLSLEKKASELEAINKEFEHYSYVVSHDLKEPLRTIYSSADFLRKDLEPLLSGSQEKYFEYLVEAVKRSFDYVDGLLALSRIGRIQQPLEEIDMRIFMKGMLNTLHLPEDVDVVLPEDFPPIESEPVLLQQIFQNLLVNAVKFNDSDRKRIEIGWSTENGNYIQFFVRDNGRGIDPSNFEKIFQIFEKVHLKDSDQGMGLGLAIVKKAANQLKGNVRVESEVGKGSTFFVVFPFSNKDVKIEI